MRRTRRGPMLIVAGLTMFLPLAWSAVASAAPSPLGNNGTVKVEGEAIDHLHDNDPHVGCAFFLQWYGFDEGTRHTTVTFDAQPPTGHGDLLLTDSFTFEGSGAGNDLDAQRSYDLTDALASFTPQAQQGFHVKLTVDTDFSQGSDVKHKVFWVSGCGEVSGESTTTTPTTETPTTETPTTATPTTATPTTETPTSAVEGTSEVATVPTTAGNAQVLGESLSRQPAAAPSAVSGAALARTGADGLIAFALCGLGLVLIGAALTRVDRRAAR